MKKEKKDPWWKPTFPRGLRWTGAALKAAGHGLTGRSLGTVGIVFEVGSIGKIVGIIIGGTIGVKLGAAAGTLVAPGPGTVIGAVGGAIIGGGIGGFAGSQFDDSDAGLLY